MSQCVPNWDLDDAVPSRFDHRPNHSGPDVPTSNYEMAELTWENGQLSMHGLGMRRVQSKHNLTATQNHKYATGTLESLVNIATQKSPPGNGVASSTRVDSCSAAATREPKKRAVVDVEDGDEGSVLKKPNLAPRVPVMAELSKSVSRSGTLGGDSWHVPTVDTCGDFGLTSTSFCSQGNTFSSNSDRPAGTNYTTTLDDRDSVCHSKLQRGTGKEEERKRGNVKSSSSTRRSRAAAVHNQSERKRRDKINQKMKLLQKMVPNSNKTDKASMLDEVIDYLKQLQAQVSMMSRISIPSMMMPHQLAMQQQQQQLQMSMMAMGMTMPAATMDINMNPAMAARQGVLNPTAAFIPVTATWDFAVPDRLPSQAPTDPISTYLASQPQSMPIEAYSRMIALIQHQQQLAAASKH